MNQTCACFFDNIVRVVLADIEIQRLVNVLVPNVVGQIRNKVAQWIALTILTLHCSADYQSQGVKSDLASIAVGVGYLESWQHAVVVFCHNDYAVLFGQFTVIQIPIFIEIDASMKPGPGLNGRDMKAFLMVVERRCIPMQARHG